MVSPLDFTSLIAKHLFHLGVDPDKSPVFQERYAGKGVFENRILLSSFLLQPVSYVFDFGYVMPYACKTGLPDNIIVCIIT